MSLFEKLISVQNELKAPKDQTNKFGGYKYRSCEDILEAVKPILKKHGCTLMLSDSVELIGERYYIKATATFSDGENSVCATALAREPLEKKGMDSAQVTGTASSYARKYALNGMFLIDDSKIEGTPDPDTQPPEDPKPEKKSGGKSAKSSDDSKEATRAQKDGLTHACQMAGVTTRWISEQVGITQGHLTVKQYNDAMQILNRIIDEEEKKHE